MSVHRYEVGYDSKGRLYKHSLNSDVVTRVNGIIVGQERDERDFYVKNAS